MRKAMQKAEFTILSNHTGGSSGNNVILRYLNIRNKIEAATVNKRICFQI